MAAPRQPEPVQFVCGIIAASEPLLHAAAEAIARELGPTGSASDIWPFDLTDYYAPQMGPDLLKQFITLEALQNPADLADWKNATNAIERQIADQARGAHAPPRPVNLDPGYIESAKLVLGSMKNFSHRVYLRDGVYAEVTLMYRGRWESLPWTFPDFASGRYDPFLTAARDDLRRRLTQKDAPE